ncbi:TonB family protein [Alloacidobacterium dinghuense]|uniref:TonB family protein n=1 Tax=Alloacidobacterium dinghuense TaxID=2763107 RepID=A0A7G8BND6_9BACT|nr:energy transducer TonB [Alloacidobacterium dinghuense]QNI34056.1 TonB family protein [Alloacidobacterium dinghuense]
MRSLFQNVEQSQERIRRTAGFSIGFHALLLALIIVGSIHLRRTVIFRPLTQGSSQQIAVVAVSRGALAAVLSAENPTLPEKSQSPRIIPTHHPTPALAKRTPALPAPEPAHPVEGKSSAGISNPGVTGQGSDAQSMYPAYPTVSPSPQVKDRSLLPQTDQKVVVDVDLGADGKVQQATLVSGLGNALDQIVLDTVRGWQFHPAMLNGQSVPSRMELVFPFNRNYPDAE